MIRERLTSATIRVVSYDPSTETLIVEFNEGPIARHTPVKYEVYRAIASSRFPEKVYRHLVADHGVPASLTER
jgi:hypothetical protein